MWHSHGSIQGQHKGKGTMPGHQMLVSLWHIEDQTPTSSTDERMHRAHMRKAKGQSM
jgi:hypothetical protein